MAGDVVVWLDQDWCTGRAKAGDGGVHVVTPHDELLGVPGRWRGQAHLAHRGVAGQGQHGLTEAQLDMLGWTSWRELKRLLKTDDVAVEVGGVQVRHRRREHRERLLGQGRPAAAA